MSGAHSHALYLHGDSPAHRLPAHAKLLALGVFVVAVVATPRNATWAFGIYLVAVGAGLRVAGVPLRFYLARLTVIVPFVLFAVFLPIVGSGPSTEVLGVELSTEGLWAAWSIIARAVLGVSASILLGATTPVADILVGLRRLRVPAALTAIAGFLIRYLDVIAGELRRMRTAMQARGYRPRWIGDAGPSMHAAGALFVRSYERGERVHRSMLSRGYRGVMPVVDVAPTPPATLLAAMSLSIVSLAAAVAALVL